MHIIILCMHFSVVFFHSSNYFQLKIHFKAFNSSWQNKRAEKRIEWAGKLGPHQGSQVCSFAGVVIVIINLENIVTVVSCWFSERIYQFQCLQMAIFYISMMFRDVWTILELMES